MRATSSTEPALASMVNSVVLSHRDLDHALSFQIARKLGDIELPPMSLREICEEAYADDRSIVAAAEADLRAVFDRVHEQALREVRGLDEGELDQPVPHPHPFAPTKLRALLWCARHEMLHAGQIGLLRRHLGYPPMS